MCWWQKIRLAVEDWRAHDVRGNREHEQSRSSIYAYTQTSTKPDGENPGNRTPGCDPMTHTCVINPGQTIVHPFFFNFGLATLRVQSTPTAATKPARAPSRPPCSTNSPYDRASASVAPHLFTCGDMSAAVTHSCPTLRC